MTLVPQLDLVCWDFGDTLCDERFMSIAPAGVPEWTAAYDECLAERPKWFDAWMLGKATLNELIEPLADQLPMTRAAIARHLRVVWHQIKWFPEPLALMRQINGSVAQAVVTVNPWEFAGIAAACGLDQLVDVIVTSAELGTTSKSEMAHHARHLLGLPAGLSTTLLIDNRSDNVGEFQTAGGYAFAFTPETFMHQVAEWFSLDRVIVTAVINDREGPADYEKHGSDDG
jgi:FMN phosphatase YigB (HAD superfamily)